MAKRKISAAELVSDIKSGMADAVLVEKYSISHDKLQVFLRTLVDKRILTQADIDGRAAHGTKPTPNVSPTPRKPEVSSTPTIPPESPTLPTPHSDPGPERRPSSVCPYCAEDIALDAKKCKHCGEWLGAPRPGRGPSLPFEQDQPICHDPAAPFEAREIMPAIRRLYRASMVVSAILATLICFVAIIPFGLALITLEGLAGKHMAYVVLSPSFFLVIGAWSFWPYRKVLAVMGGKAAETTDLRDTLLTALNVAVAQIIYASMVFLGLALLLVPGVIWACKYALYLPFIIERRVGPITALKMSADITKGRLDNMWSVTWRASLLNNLGTLLLGIGLFFTYPRSAIAYCYAYHRLLFLGTHDTGGYEALAERVSGRKDAAVIAGIAAFLLNWVFLYFRDVPK